MHGVGLLVCVCVCVCVCMCVCICFCGKLSLLVLDPRGGDMVLVRLLHLFRRTILCHLAGELVLHGVTFNNKIDNDKYHPDMG